MIKPAQLKLDIFNVDAELRRELFEKIRGSVVIISDTEIKAYKDGREQDMSLDFVYGPGLRFDNDNGIYTVPEEDTTDASADQASEGMTDDAIKGIWQRRRMANHISTITSQSLAPGAIYAARRGQVSA